MKAALDRRRIRRPVRDRRPLRLRAAGRPPVRDEQTGRRLQRPRGDQVRRLRQRHAERGQHQQRDQLGNRQDPAGPRARQQRLEPQHRPQRRRPHLPLLRRRRHPPRPAPLRSDDEHLRRQHLHRGERPDRGRQPRRAGQLPGSRRPDPRRLDIPLRRRAAALHGQQHLRRGLLDPRHHRQIRSLLRTGGRRRRRRPRLRHLDAEHRRRHPGRPARPTGGIGRGPQPDRHDAPRRHRVRDRPLLPPPRPERPLQVQIEQGGPGGPDLRTEIQGHEEETQRQNDSASPPKKARKKTATATGRSAKSNRGWRRATTRSPSTARSPAAS